MQIKYVYIWQKISDNSPMGMKIHLKGRPTNIDSF